MTIKGIRDNVQALLTASDYFVSVIPAPQKGEAYNFTGYPSVSHYYRDTQSDYATVSQNRRVIEYVIEMVLVVNKATDVVTEFDEAYTLVDDVIQLLDESIDLSSAALSLTRACDIMRPAPGELLPTQTNKGEGLVMTIRLFCEADVRFKY